MESIGPEPSLPLGLKWTKIRQLVAIITGYNGLNKHLHTIGRRGEMENKL